MTGDEILENKELSDFIKTNSDFINNMVSNDYLFMETLWVICEDYYKLRTKINKNYDTKRKSKRANY